MTQPCPVRQLNPHAGVIFRAPSNASGTLHEALHQFAQQQQALLPPPPPSLHPPGPAPAAAAPFPPAASSTQAAKHLAGPVQNFPKAMIGSGSGSGSSLASQTTPVSVSATMQQFAMRNHLINMEESEFRALLCSLGNIYPSLVSAIEHEVKKQQVHAQTTQLASSSALQLNAAAKPFTPPGSAVIASSAMY
jgi:hypothetical protein